MSAIERGLTPGRYPNRSEASKANWKDPLYREKMTQALKGRPSPMQGRFHTPESRRKMSEAHQGKPSPAKGRRQTPEARAKISEACKKRWQDPEFRARMSEAHKAIKKDRPPTPESREETSKDQKRKVSPAPENQIVWETPPDGAKTPFSRETRLSLKQAKMELKKRILEEEKIRIGTEATAIVLSHLVVKKSLGGLNPLAILEQICDQRIKMSELLGCHGKADPEKGANELFVGLVDETLNRLRHLEIPSLKELSLIEWIAKLEKQGLDQKRIIEVLCLGIALPPKTRKGMDSEEHVSPQIKKPDGRRKIKVDPDVVKEVLRLKSEQGLSDKAIGERFGISKSTVLHYRKEFELDEAGEVRRRHFRY